jgi:hypothetical protein
MRPTPARTNAQAAHTSWAHAVDAHSLGKERRDGFLVPRAASVEELPVGVELDPGELRRQRLGRPPRLARAAQGTRHSGGPTGGAAPCALDCQPATLLLNTELGIESSRTSQMRFLFRPRYP